MATTGANLREELCEPSLTFWLIEELLDSQTINGCRLVFDYLESRRERIIVVSPLGQSVHLVVEICL